MAEQGTYSGGQVASKTSETPEIVSGMVEADKTGETVDSDSKKGPISREGAQGSEERRQQNSLRAEIDTSAPFESVKAAVSRFGRMGFWRSNCHKSSENSMHGIEVIDIANMEEQAAQLEKELIVKERETLDVLKELETTKHVAEELKLKLRKEASEVNTARNANSDDKSVVHTRVVAEKEIHENFASGQGNSVGDLGLCPSSTPGFILMELKQAKLNLTRTINDIADIQVESEKIRQTLTANSLKISSLEDEINQTKLKLEVVKDANVKGVSDGPIDISRELQRLRSEAEQFKKTGEAAKSEMSRALSAIEQTGTRIKTAEIRLAAARKIKEAARASEAVALAEIKALSNNENSSGLLLQQKVGGVTLSFEEYSSLTTKAQDAENVSKSRVVDAMLQVDEANVSKTEILNRVDVTMEEVKTSKKVLEAALNRVEAANKGKLAVEEALRKWRSEHSQKRRTVQNYTKFKYSHPAHYRKDSHLLDANGLNLTNDESEPVLKPTLSIGQIMNRKLLLREEYDNGKQMKKRTGKRKVSLAQLLGKLNDDFISVQKGESECGHKQLPAKRKKFGFARISLLVTKKKKRQPASSRCRSA